MLAMTADDQNETGAKSEDPLRAANAQLRAPEHAYVREKLYVPSGRQEVGFASHLRTRKDRSSPSAPTDHKRTIMRNVRMPRCGDRGCVVGAQRLETSL